MGATSRHRPRVTTKGGSRRTIRRRQSRRRAHIRNVKMLDVKDKKIEQLQQMLHEQQSGRYGNAEEPAQSSPSALDIVVKGEEQTSGDSPHISAVPQRLVPEFTNQRYGVDLSSESESAPVEKTTTVTTEESGTVPTNEHRCELAHDTAHMGAFVTYAPGDTQAELYHRVADAFANVRASDVLYCTHGVRELNEDTLLSDDPPNGEYKIFAHVKGSTTVINFIKSSAMIGLSLASNGAGRVFVLRVATASIAELASITPGMVVLRVNEMVVGPSDTYSIVSDRLRRVPLDRRVSLTLLSPLACTFSWSMVNGRWTHAKHVSKTDAEDDVIADKRARLDELLSPHVADAEKFVDALMKNEIATRRDVTSALGVGEWTGELIEQVLDIVRVQV